MWGELRVQPSWDDGRASVGYGARMSGGGWADPGVRAWPRSPAESTAGLEKKPSFPAWARGHVANASFLPYKTAIVHGSKDTPPPMPRKWLSLSRCQQHQGGVRGARKTGAWSSGAPKYGLRPPRAEHPSGGCPPPQKGGATEAAWPPVWGAVPPHSCVVSRGYLPGQGFSPGCSGGAHGPRQLDEEETGCSSSRLCCPEVCKVLRCFSCSASFSSKNLVKLEKTLKPFFFFCKQVCFSGQMFLFSWSLRGCAIELSG